MDGLAPAQKEGFGTTYLSDYLYHQHTNTYGSSPHLSVQIIGICVVSTFNRHLSQR